MFYTRVSAYARYHIPVDSFSLNCRGIEAAPIMGTTSSSEAAPGTMPISNEETGTGPGYHILAVRLSLN